MKTIYVTLFLAACALISCADNQKETKISESLELQTESPEGQLNLKHNNGSKWQANAETTDGVKAMQQHIATFKEKGSTDYKALKSQLEAEFEYVFQKCTMKGESHNQLHNFLYPMKALFEDLSKNPKTAQKAIYKLEQHIPVYFQYFE